MAEQPAGVLVAFPQRPGFEPWVSKAHVASYLGRSTRWVELRVRDGLPSQMIGGRRSFRLSAVDAWIRDRFG